MFVIQACQETLLETLEHNRDCEEVKSRQLQSMAVARAVLREKWINFVQPRDVQRRRYENMQATLNKIRNQVGRGWVQRSPAVKLFTRWRTNIARSAKKLDHVRTSLLFAAFWSIVAIASVPAALFTAMLWLGHQVLSLPDLE